MASEGPNSTGTVTQTNTSAPDWVDVNNVKVSDNVYSTVAITAGPNGQSEYMSCTNFGFTIPAGSLINGILVEIECKTSVAVGAQFYELYLVNSGSKIGNSKYTINISTVEAYVSGGGTADLWGATLTDTIVNDTTFGLSFVAYATSGACTISVDHVRMTVYYTVVVDKTLTDAVSSVTETISKATQSFDYSIANNNQAYILNLKTGYWTFQNNCPFTNAIYRPSTQQIIASRRDIGQITRLDYGSTFDNTNIDATIKTGDMNLGELDEIKAANAEASEAIKKLRAIFMEVIGEGNLTLKVYSETNTSGTSFTITVPTKDNATLNVIRTALSRNLKGKYYAYEITNTSGDDFWVGEQRIKIMARKIK